MKYIIRKSDGPLTFVHSSREREIVQNITNILNTPKGSIPGYRQFGIDMSYLHMPVQVARTMFAVALNNAIREFEPRARMVNVTFEDNAENAHVGILNPVLEVEIDE